MGQPPLKMVEQALMEALVEDLVVLAIYLGTYLEIYLTKDIKIIAKDQ